MGYRCDTFEVSARIESVRAASDKQVRTAGAFRPMGEAVVVDGGYRATGRWPLGSGCQHSAWIVGGCRILDGDRPRLRADGSPVTRILFFPAADCEILDTWHSIGLRGTGSHDYAVSDVFVPSARSLRSAIPRASLARFTVCRRSRCSQPDWRRCRSGSPGMRSTSCWSWRKPRSLAARGGRCARMRRYANLGQAEALLRSGRAFLYETLAETWRVASAGEPLTVAQRAMLWLAATHAATVAKQATELAFTAGGSASPYVGGGLERCLRDVQAACQHVALAAPNYLMAGQALLGLDMRATVLLFMDDRSAE